MCIKCLIESNQQFKWIGIMRKTTTYMQIVMERFLTWIAFCSGTKWMCHPRAPYGAGSTVSVYLRVSWYLLYALASDIKLLFPCHYNDFEHAHAHMSSMWIPRCLFQLKLRYFFYCHCYWLWHLNSYARRLGLAELYQDTRAFNHNVLLQICSSICTAMERLWEIARFIKYATQSISIAG